MRSGFWPIADGWQQDDLIRLGERLNLAAAWLRRNGGAAGAQADERETFELMFRKQITLAVQAGAFEPFVSASLDEDEIIRMILDEPDLSKPHD
jgi:hypothetical protein